MELIQPTITITNAEGDFWLVRIEHRFDAHQRLDITVQIRKMPTAPLHDVARAALARMDEMLRDKYR